MDSPGLKTDSYIVKRRETTVIPVGIEVGNKLNKWLSYVFLTWSIIVIICYFAGVEIPDCADIAVSMSAIAISIVYSLYNYYSFKSHNLYKVGIVPTTSGIKKSVNIKPLEVNSGFSDISPAFV